MQQAACVGGEGWEAGIISVSCTTGPVQLLHGSAVSASTCRVGQTVLQGPSQSLHLPSSSWNVVSRPLTFHLWHGWAGAVKKKNHTLP